MGTYALTHNASIKNQYTDSKDTIYKTYSELEKMMSNHPKQLEKLELTRRMITRVIKIGDGVVALTDQGEEGINIIEVAGMRRQVEALVTDSVKHLKDLVDMVNEQSGEKSHDALQWREEAKQLLLAGVIGNIVLSIILALLFTRGITNRLKVLSDNVHRVASGKSLNERLKGNDEIASIDSAFHDMKDAIEEADKLKREFVAMISHDLRTPLSTVQMQLELLRKGNLATGDQAMVSSANRQLDRLIQLINNLLDVQKMESDGYVIEQKVISVRKLIEVSVESVKALADSKQITIEAPRVSAFINADEQALSQVLINFLSNAVKFSPSGSQIKISFMESEDAIELAVIDQGRGVPKSHQTLIFERFKQVETSDSKELKGSGLGLAISKLIIDAHGGTIGVDEIDGGGSKFWFKIPFTSNKS